MATPQATKKGAAKAAAKKRAPAAPKPERGQKRLATETGGTAKKRDNRARLARRDTDEQVERIIEKKLKPLYPMDMIAAAVHADGSTPRSLIAAEVKATKTTGEHLKQEFWSRFFQKFPLRLASIVPEPAGHHAIRQDVLDAVAPMHHDNPAMRSASTLATYLEDVQDLSPGELHGIILRSQTISGEMRRQAILALLAYIKKTGAEQKWPAMISPLLPYAAQMLMQAFDERRRLPAENWMRAHFAELSVFIPS